MAFCLSKLSRDRLQGVRPDLVRVVERAIQIGGGGGPALPTIIGCDDPADVASGRSVRCRLTGPIATRDVPEAVALERAALTRARVPT